MTCSQPTRPHYRTYPTQARQMRKSMRSLQLAIWYTLTITLHAHMHNEREPAIFHTIGEVATDTTAFFIIGRLDLDPIEDQLHHIQEILRYLKKATPSTEDSPDQVFTKQVQLIEVDTIECLSRIENLRNLNQSPARSERSALLVLAGLTALGGALGAILSHHQISTRIDALEVQRNSMLHYLDATSSQMEVNKHRIAHLNATITELVKHEIGFEKKIKTQQRKLQAYIQKEALLSLTQYAVTQATHNIYAILDTWTRALHGQITIDLFQPQLVREALKRMSSQTNGPLKLAFEPTDLEAFYKLHCNTDMRQGQLRVVVPIPVYNIKETFTVHRYLAMPISTTQGQE
ncbi:uncharacterized protein LOC131892161 [Tigriopus californicus]|uniref:uncharacterized protein LOC131892161 n=1 Tax=Tigriopus californicus TaxID=6832 RepID=UPI0027D9F851|nr:uncharacterized protein LOC131892161 [Tigriopus californicus]